jgi:hypothetical protein
VNKPDGAEANEKARPKEIQSDGLKLYVPKEKFRRQSTVGTGYAKRL